MGHGVGVGVDSADTLEKILQFRFALSELIGIVQFGPEEIQKTDGVFSWSELIEMGKIETEDKLKERILSQAPNFCCNVSLTETIFGKYKSFSKSGGAHISFHPLSQPIGMLVDIFIPLVYATTVYFVPRKFIKTQLIEILSEVRPTFLATVPFFFERIADQVKLSFETSAFKKIVLENKSWKIGRKAYRNSCGVEMDGCRTRFVPVEKTSYTELRVKGRNVFMGYLNEPQMTADAFDEDGWHRTGDLGYRDESGFMWIVGSLYELYTLTDGRIVAPIVIEEDIKNLLPFMGHCFAYRRYRPYAEECLGRCRCVFDVSVAATDEVTEVPLDILSTKAEVFLRNLNVEVSAISDMVEHPPENLVSVIQTAIDEVNAASQNSAAIIRKWKFLPRDFSVPTVEMKRNRFGSCGVEMDGSKTRFVPIGQTVYNEPALLMEMTFQNDYPMTPPFVRVVCPRFKFLPGHVTIGGGMRSGWSPSNDKQFFLREGDIGTNRANATCPRLAELNAYVPVSAYTGKLNPEFLSQFQVLGKKELNGREPRPVKVFGPYTFSIGDMSQLSDYVRHGVATQVKMPKTVNFVCRKDCMETGRTVVLLNLENLYESLYDALNQYYVRFGDQRFVDLGLGTQRVKCRVHQFFRLMVVAEKQVVYEKFPIPLINRLEKHFLAMSTMLTAEQMEVADRLSKWATDFTSVHGIAPRSMKQPKPASVFIGCHPDTAASLVLQVRHSGTNTEQKTKLTSQQILDEAKDLRCAVPEAILRLNNTRLAASANEIYKKYFEEHCHSNLEDFLKRILDEECPMESLFVQIGAGAIGCEMLKNWAMMGIATGGNGKIIVTDTDVIEKSNLNRQFRPGDVQKTKALTAANAVKQMNPTIVIEHHENRVGPDTENVYDDDFFDMPDVTNALDNIDARMYVDRCCVYYRKPLLESGTLGTKGNVQVVIPHITESYESPQDPPEKSIPICTLKNFPNAIGRTLQLNGALTIGTLDGANVEMREEMGAANFFLFGMTVHEVEELAASGYSPRPYYEKNAELRQCIDKIAGGYFSPEDSNLFRDIIGSLMHHDHHDSSMLFADYESYISSQREDGKTLEPDDNYNSSNNSMEMDTSQMDFRFDQMDVDDQEFFGPCSGKRPSPSISPIEPSKKQSKASVEHLITLARTSASKPSVLPRPMTQQRRDAAAAREKQSTAQKQRAAAATAAAAAATAAAAAATAAAAAATAAAAAATAAAAAATAAAAAAADASTPPPSPPKTWKCFRCNINNRVGLHLCTNCRTNRKIAEIPPPLNWTSKPDPTEPSVAIQLGRREQQFTDIRSVIRKVTTGTVNGIPIMSTEEDPPDRSVYWIKRNENVTLFQEYQSEKMKMEEELGAENICERMAWHGTASGNVYSITSEGFSLEHVGKTGAVWGHGIYMSTCPGYSLDKKFAKLDFFRRKTLLLCRVLVGNFTQGAPSLKKPPLVPGGNGRRFKTVVDDVKRPLIVCVFNPKHIFPEFVLKVEDEDY